MLYIRHLHPFKSRGLSLMSSLATKDAINILSETSAAKKTSPIIDIGANLLDGMFQGKYHGKKRHVSDLPLVLERAQKAGVSKIICTAGSINESKTALAFCRKYNEEKVKDNSQSEEAAMKSEPPLKLFSTVGIHPTQSSRDFFDKIPLENSKTENESDAISSAQNEALNDSGHTSEKTESDPDNNFQLVPKKHLKAELIDIISTGTKDGTVVAIGELGLDYDRLFFADKQSQKYAFLQQLDIAEKFTLPLFLHSRSCHEDFIKIMRENKTKWEKGGGVVHSFTGSLKEALECIELGLYIGINGCSLKTDENLKVAAGLPLDKIMLETDAPWCSIKRTHAGFHHIQEEHKYERKKDKSFVEGKCVKGRCEPCDIWHVVDVLSGIRDESAETIIEQTYLNTKKLFFSRSSSFI
eukprot:g3406.t1